MKRYADIEIMFHRRACSWHLGVDSPPVRIMGDKCNYATPAGAIKAARKVAATFGLCVRDVSVNGVVQPAPSRASGGV